MDFQVFVDLHITIITKVQICEYWYVCIYVCMFVCTYIHTNFHTIGLSTIQLMFINKSSFLSLRTSVF